MVLWYDARIMTEEVIAAAKELSREMDALSFESPVAYTYNPLHYAWAGHEAYIRRYAGGKKKVLYLGMNPGPFGMAQTGVPFGEIAAVSLWMGITAPVGEPPAVHPKRPVQGFACPRSEVSGRRLWSLFAEMYGSADAFFAHSYVANYCPLIWMSESGANITPAQLPKEQADRIDEACRRHLRRLIGALEPCCLIGVGAYALRQLETVAVSIPERQFTLGSILHPSPASPVANKYWPERPRKQIQDILREAGLSL